MPEAAEVEVVRRTVAPELLGFSFAAPFLSGLPLRNRSVKKSAFRALLGPSVTSVGRHGKLLWIALENGAGLMVHLGMTGRLLVEEEGAPREKHTHLELTLVGRNKVVRFVDPRRFGQVLPFSTTSELDDARARLGPDPLELAIPEVRAALAQRLRTRKRALKDVLLDQHLFAGVGNIYACEALFRARLSPFRRASGLSRDEAESLVDAARAAVEKGIADKGTTLSDFVDAYGRKGGHQDNLLVFARAGEPCRECGAVVQRAVQGGRSTFFCARCQKARGGRSARA